MNERAGGRRAPPRPHPSHRRDPPSARAPPRREAHLGELRLGVLAPLDVGGELVALELFGGGARAELRELRLLAAQPRVVLLDGLLEALELSVRLVLLRHDGVAWPVDGVHAALHAGLDGGDLAERLLPLLVQVAQVVDIAQQVARPHGELLLLGRRPLRTLELALERGVLGLGLLEHLLHRG